MRISRLIVASTVTLALTASACTTEPGSQTDAVTEGALGFAPAIAFGQPVTGQVASPQLDIWSIYLRAGDTVRITKTVTGGDLKPDVVLFQGSASHHVASDDFDVTTNTLAKTYSLDDSGSYVIVVRGYQNQGAGSYTLSVECLAGPCAGETPPAPVVELGSADKQSCIKAARECAVARLPEYGGAVGAVRSQQIFDECLGAATVETWEHDLPVSCAPACQGDDAAEVCDAVVAMLPWLADQSPSCIDEFNDCVLLCYEAGNEQAMESVAGGGEATCVTGYAAFNGSCGDVAQLQACGGPWAPGSCEACYLSCYDSMGAWLDDLDMICDEACDCVPGGSL